MTLKPWWGLLFGILIGLLAAGVILLAATQPRGEPVSLLPLPTLSPLIIHINGAVANPGVYQLPAGSRVNDAIIVAGGLLSNANDQDLNLAAPLQDGQLIHISTAPPTQANASSDITPAVQTTLASNLIDPTAHLVDINTADQAELESLPGIGPVLAQRIIKYRTKYGLFNSIEDINVIYGLLPETYELIKNLITVTIPLTPTP